MSAFVVSHKHINTLLSWANRNQVSIVPLIDGGDIQRIEWAQIEHLQRAAEILLTENVRSVSELYKDSPSVIISGDLPIDFKFETAHLEPVAIVKACQCYEYQADSAPGYRDGNAARIVLFIQSKAIQLLLGYKQADWEVQ